MKEIEYNDLNGLESTTTNRQLDHFEARGAKALPIRNIFDFTTNIDYTPSVTGGGLIAVWRNLIINDDSWNGYSGAPGHANLMIDKLPVWSNDYPQGISDLPWNDELIKQNVKDISNEFDVPYWNENAIIYLDQNYIGSVSSRTASNTIKEFRSGHIEITLKTDKQNCIIGMGTVRKTYYESSPNPDYVGNSEAERTYSRLTDATVSVVDNESAYISDELSNDHTLYIKIKNGKLNLEYFDDFGPNKKEFSIDGNINIADNNWHHIIINFGKPGVVRSGEKKFNERFIEFWVDGKLDKRTKEYVNNSQIYFPVIEWLLMDPIAVENFNQERYWKGLANFIITDVDINPGYSLYYTHDNYSNLINRNFDNAKANAFRGSIHHFSSGINNPLDKLEIQQRHRLYIGSEKNIDNFVANAEMINPSIQTNKKKALKLFWNKLVNDGKNGIELDNHFDIYTYSVTHKIQNSSSEVYNLDLTNNKTINYIPDVKVVLKENVLMFGPGKELLLNRSEVWNQQVGQQSQLSASNLGIYDGLNSVGTDFSISLNSKFSNYTIQNLLFSGIALNNGDRLLLTNQINKKENGIYIFNGLDKALTRDENLRSPSQINNGVVRVIDGYYKDTSWILTNTITSLNDIQEWVQIENHPTENDINTQPIFMQRWSNEKGEERFIDLQEDLNISNFDIIVFMNYPETNEEIKEHFIGYNDFEIQQKYNTFIQLLKTVVANGAKLFVSSPRLAQDLGIVKGFTEVPQLLQDSDAASASFSPFELTEPAERYFDTQRNNRYHVATTVAGLTNKETYLLTDFINFTPETQYDFDQYHAKYSYRQFGLQEGNEFIIPGTALRKITENPNLPGYKENQRGTKPLMAVEPSNILAGTIITKLANNYYNGSTITANPYDDYATTIIVHNGQLLGGTPINGKIFVNCVEDGYTFSREEYNKAVIQVLPQTDINETVATRAWQYSTTRLNRKPQRLNISGLSSYGQTTPTSGGGGAFIQAPSNSSYGVIRSETDKGNVDYQSDLYPTEEEEIYPLQEIPVLSMTWLGLQWLAG
jgi:hypothetical protein